MDGRVIRFASTGTRADHAAQLMHEALPVTRDPNAVLVSFAETLSRSESDVLRQTLKKKQKTGR